MSGNKGTRINVCVALAMICFILMAGLGVTIAYYAPQIAKYNDYETTHTHTDNEYNVLNYSNTDLQNRVNELTKIANLDNSTAWVNNQTITQGPSNSTTWSFDASYAGYINILIFASNATNARIWVFSGVLIGSQNVDSTQQDGFSIGSHESDFMVMPSMVTIQIVNLDKVNSAIEILTITYNC